ncbi:MAG: hypothetical protein PHT40_01425 [Patescibacteria group bacterium]|nr:hypothetical protein [Patescibacteria group bacterium]
MAATPVIPKHAPLVYTPRFFQPEKAFQGFAPDLNGAYREGVEYALAHHLKSAEALIKAGIKNLAMLTDLQNGFRDDPFGELPVTGTNEVVLKVCVRLINGTVTDYFSGLIYSQDGHTRQHISFDYYWRDHKGLPLDLSGHGRAALATLVDEKKAIFRVYGFDGKGGTYDIGFYQPKFNPLEAVDYWKHLQKTGQGDIWIFVPHCMLGTFSANLHPLLDETISFMAGARSLQPIPINKGHIMTTDWFGPLEPCKKDDSHPQGRFQSGVIKTFEEFLNIEFSGVAEDFCDYYMKKQTMDNLSDTAYLAKLAFMTDGTAPIIPNAAHVVALNERAKKTGVRFFTHDAPFVNA